MQYAMPQIVAAEDHDHLGRFQFVMHQMEIPYLPEPNRINPPYSIDINRVSRARAPFVQRLAAGDSWI